MANKEISELTAAATLDGTELVHVVQGGNSRKTTTGDVAAFLLIDEDSFATDSATKAPSQQSVKAYIDTAIPAKMNASGSAPVYACRAWVNFNGTGTVAIRASGNVSSITDNGTGDYTVNFTTGMPDANYAWACGGSLANSYTVTARAEAASPSTNALRLGTFNAGTAATDAAWVNLTVFR